MANFCRNCGNPLNEIDKFCGTCGTPVDAQQPAQNGQQVQAVQPVQEQGISPEDNAKANRLTAISLILNVLVAPFVSKMMESFEETRDGLTTSVNTLSPLLGFIGVICEFGGLALLIYVRVKYPKNVFSKVLMILYIVLFVAYLILMVVAIVTCAETIRNCPG